MNKNSFFKWFKYEKTSNRFGVILLLCWLWAMVGIIVLDFTVKASPTPVGIVYKEKEEKQDSYNVLKMQRFIRHKNPNSPKSIALEIARNVEVKTYGSSLPFELILAMIDTESNFDPYAVSNKEAHGLMQIKVGEFIDNKKKIVIEKDKIHDIDYNIISGINVFNEHLTLSNGNVRQALTTYVGGDKEYSNKVLQTIGEWVLFRYELGI